MPTSPESLNQEAQELIEKIADEIKIKLESRLPKVDRFGPLTPPPSDPKPSLPPAEVMSAEDLLKRIQKEERREMASRLNQGLSSLSEK